MTLKQLVILLLPFTWASAMASDQDAETYFGLTFVKTVFTVESPVNVVALDGDDWRANGIDLQDGQPFYTPYNFTAKNVSYTRTFDNTYWQPLYLPYDMRYDDWCDVAQVAALTEVFQYDEDIDGVIDTTVLAFETVDDGTITPNAPYIIRPFNTGTVVFNSENCTFRATPTVGGRVVCSATNLVFSLIGVYENMAVSGYLGDYDLYANAFRLSTGGVVDPNGIYLQVSPNDDGYEHVGFEALPTVVLLKIDDELVGITDITVDSAAPAKVYDIYGRESSGTPNGVYITVKDGKASKVVNNNRK